MGHDEPERSHNRTAGAYQHETDARRPAISQPPLFIRAKNAEGSDNFSLSLVSAIDRLAGNDKLKFVGHFQCRSYPTKHIPLTGSRLT